MDQFTQWEYKDQWEAFRIFTKVMRRKENRIRINIDDDIEPKPEWDLLSLPNIERNHGGKWFFE